MGSTEKKSFLIANMIAIFVVVLGIWSISSRAAPLPMGNDSLRDAFAQAALTGIIASGRTQSAQVAGELAYEYADLALVARNKWRISNER